MRLYERHKADNSTANCHMRRAEIKILCSLTRSNTENDGDAFINHSFHSGELKAIARAIILTFWNHLILFASLYRSSHQFMCFAPSGGTDTEEKRQAGEWNMIVQKGALSEMERCTFFYSHFHKNDVKREYNRILSRSKKAKKRAETWRIDFLLQIAGCWLNANALRKDSTYAIRVNRTLFYERAGGVMFFRQEHFNYNKLHCCWTHLPEHKFYYSHQRPLLHALFSSLSLHFHNMPLFFVAAHSKHKHCDVATLTQHK